jgi:murein DD-endopeptidase MepM/ murein hydrolase activator NlpD
MTFIAAIIAIATVPALALGTLTIPSTSPKGLPHSSSAATGGNPNTANVAHPSEARGEPASSVGPQLPDEPQPAAGPWSWPLLPIPRVVRGFQIGPDPWSPGHRGVDLESRPDAAVRAPAAGVIRFSGELAGRPVLAIDHGGGLISSFEPAIGRLPAGSRVQAGEVVANLAPGPNHCSPGSCLHWGVRRDGRYVDPLSLLPGVRGPAILLPMLS